MLSWMLYVSAVILAPSLAIKTIIVDPHYVNSSDPADQPRPSVRFHNVKDLTFHSIIERNPPVSDNSCAELDLHLLHSRWWYEGGDLG